LDPGLAPLRFGSSEVERWAPHHKGQQKRPPRFLGHRPIAGGGSREVVAQSLEQAPGAFLAARPVGPELVEEDAVLDVREPGESQTRSRGTG